MDNMIFLLGLFLLSVANVKAQTLTQTDSLTMETMLHNLPEVMVKGSRPIVAKTEHSHPLGMVVSTHFRCGKGVKRGLKNGALPFNID